MALWHSNLEDTVSPKINEEQERSRKILSKKAKTQRAEIANAVKYGKVSLSDTATDKESERHEVDTRKEASDKFKVSEMRVGPKKT